MARSGAAQATMPLALSLHGRTPPGAATAEEGRVRMGAAALLHVPGLDPPRVLWQLPVIWGSQLYHADSNFTEPAPAAGSPARRHRRPPAIATSGAASVQSLPPLIRPVDAAVGGGASSCSPRHLTMQRDAGPATPRSSAAEADLPPLSPRLSDAVARLDTHVQHLERRLRGASMDLNVAAAAHAEQRRQSRAAKSRIEALYAAVGGDDLGHALGSAVLARAAAAAAAAMAEKSRADTNAAFPTRRRRASEPLEWTAAAAAAAAASPMSLPTLRGDGSPNAQRCRHSMVTSPRNAQVHLAVATVGDVRAYEHRLGETLADMRLHNMALR